ncbi:gelsolin-like protein 2 [Acanthaster planci]|uniref:Gelsolin-like protein 2 n=1 Tax=Acanthaster planci TaxID=133434 RepID=A0A8B7YJE1_ACAPL|nr:gelsolin-like protein 2 [Acanthaster planci]XP_022092738.1 gelsolin-like protein 2 [Acanthaster planci]
MPGGLVKAKKYDWKDSNLALFGSDTEKQVKKASAETEPAWRGAGQKVGLQIWRIVKFKVQSWPKEDYGKFFSGDSYIILNTYKEQDSEELLYDVHFWIGQYSTQDEYGTAAYKTVELDTLLDDKPIQHREVMSHESNLFKSYFATLSLMEGGAESGFRHVKPTEYEPRLFHFHGTKKSVQMREVPLSRKSLDSTDVFILDLGLELYQWNGATCNKDEKFKAVQYLQQVKSERGGKPTVESLDERDIPSSHKFYEKLPDQEVEKEEEDDTDFQPSIFRVSDETGSMEMTLVSEGKLGRSYLESKDVFLVDSGKELYVWVGNGASPDEQKNGLTYAHSYLMKTKHPLIPVTVYKEGKESAEFNSLMK